MTSKTRGGQQVLGNTAPLFSLKRTEGVTKESQRAHLQHGPLMLSPHKQLDLSSLPSSLFPSFVLCLQFLLHLFLLPILSVLHYVSLCTLKSLVWQAANSLHCPLHIFHATASGVRIWGLQKRMFCGSQPSEGIERGQHSQMGDYLAATPVSRKATHAEIPVAFPSLIWKKSLETEERIALLCGFGFLFPF